VSAEVRLLRLREAPAAEVRRILVRSQARALEPSTQEAVRTLLEDVERRGDAAVVDATRRHEAVYLGASPRGSLALQRGSQARALLDQRDFVLPDDVKAPAYPVLGHRIIVSAASRVKGVTAQQVVEDCLGRVHVPGVRARGP